MDYRCLPNTAVSAAGCFIRDMFNPPTVTADSTAVSVMTDLTKVSPATIHQEPNLEEANQSMILRGVRLLLVIDGHSRLVGVVTTVDLLGEKPLMVAQKRQSRRSDLRVADVMTPVENMEILRIEDVLKGSVGDIVATLKSDGRSHALVVSTTETGVQHLAGIFSISQIARQLGVQIQTHEMARTFAEVEAVIAGI